MNGSDITSAVLIIIIFALLQMFNVFSIGIKHIKNNWPLYRCNPMILPIANVFGHDTMTNFTNCISSTNFTFLGHILDPIYYSINSLTDIGSNFHTTNNNFRSFHSSFRSNIMDSVLNVFNIFLNILVEFQKIIIKLKDTFGKMVGILAVLIFTISGVDRTSRSIWNGPIGGITRALCFHPDTKIAIYEENNKTNNNKFIYKKMKDLEPGDIIKGGTKVCATMKINNLEGNNYIEKLYEIDYGEKNESILVSGSHLIYDPISKKFIQVKNLKSYKYNIRISDINTPVFSCLITSDHIIPIGKHIFHDWEDNNGSSAKNLL
jgi:hypothetical protein